ncbi:tol-pal system-associated acyl-CoA thioesterase [Pseudaeromonas sp. ZJS20]|uniref:tol-pal system-associated acyl-CoA thioesterase n=1 Tax=Pseudaeromonas aegiceratis TaxID=3153928 RepID=UPI00390CC925
MTAEFEIPVRIYYEDTDAGGVVYYANYLKFMERCRTEWLRSLGVEQDGWLAEGIAFVVRAVTVDYHAPARFNDQIRVACRLATLKRASLVFHQQILDVEGRPLISGQVTIACVNLQQMKPTPIPEPIYGVLRSATR